MKNSKGRPSQPTWCHTLAPGWPKTPPRRPGSRWPFSSLFSKSKGVTNTACAALGRRVRAAVVVLVLLFGCGEAQVVGEECTMRTGDLVITEIFANPKGQDANSEWFEVYNASGRQLALDGLQLVRLSGIDVAAEGGVTGVPHTHQVRYGGGVAAGDYFVFGDGTVEQGIINYSYQAADSATGLGKSIGPLAQTGGLRLLCGGVEVDQVIYLPGHDDFPSLPEQAGVSLSLSGVGEPDAVLNDKPDWWCSGGDAFDEEMNVGSPGRENIHCGRLRCRDEQGLRRPHPPQVGEVVVNEILVDAEGSDAGQLWIELAIAPGAGNVDLNSLEIVVRPSSANPTRPPPTAELQSRQCLAVSAGDLVVIGEGMDPSTDGRQSADFIDLRVPRLGVGYSQFVDGGRVELRLAATGQSAAVVIDSAILPPVSASPTGPSHVECAAFVDSLACKSGPPKGCSWNSGLGASGYCLGVRRTAGRSLGVDPGAQGLDSQNDAAGDFCYANEESGDGLSGDSGAADAGAEQRFRGYGTPGAVNEVCGTSVCMAGGKLRPVRRAAPGELLITEVYANPDGLDTDGEWIEFEVLGQSVDLNGLRVEVRRPDGALVRGVTLASPDCISAAAGQLRLLNFVHDQHRLYGPDLGGVLADILVPTPWRNGFLPHASMRLRLVARGTVDEASLPAAVSGSSAMLSAAAYSIAGNDSAAGFCRAASSDKLAGEFSGRGTPGLPNTCRPACAADVRAVEPGELVINELLVDPSGTDRYKMWIELAVASSAAVDLNGLSIVALSNDVSRADLSATIAAGACVAAAPGELVVIAQSLDPLQNGGVSPTVALPQLKFGQAHFARGGAVELRRAETLIDRAQIPAVRQTLNGPSPADCAVHAQQATCEVLAGAPGQATGCRWDTWAAAGGRCLGVYVAAGRSLGVDLAARGDAALNDARGSLCVAPDTAEGNFAGLGTPGQANWPCGTSMCRDTEGIRPTVFPAAADLIITEVLANPEGDDRSGEWVEVYALADGVDLNGLTLEVHRLDGSGQRAAIFAAADCVTLAAGQYGLLRLVYTDDIAIGALPVGGPSIAGVVRKRTGFLPNGPLLLRLWGEDLVDEARLPASVSGASQMLHPAVLTPSANDDAAAFCLASNVGEQSATPGAANICPEQCAAGPEVGNFVITEWLADPSGADGRRDWIEFVSLAATAVPVNGLVVESESAGGSLRRWPIDFASCVGVEPGQYFVAGGVGALAEGLLLDAVLNGGPVSMFFNGSMGLRLTSGGAVIDETPIQDSVAGLSLTSSALRANRPHVRNDSPNEWCEPMLASPGLPNELCP